MNGLDDFVKAMSVYKESAKLIDRNVIYLESRKAAGVLYLKFRKFIEDHPNADMAEVVSKANEIFGSRVANKLSQWVVEEEYQGNNRKFKFSQSFVLAARRYEKVRRSLEKNSCYLAYKGNKAAYKEAAKRAIENGFAEDKLKTIANNVGKNVL